MPAPHHITQHGHTRCHAQQSLPGAEAHQRGIGSVPVVWQGSWLVIHTFLQPQTKRQCWCLLHNEECSQKKASMSPIVLTTAYLSDLQACLKRRKKREKKGKKKKGTSYQLILSSFLLRHFNVHTNNFAPNRHFQGFSGKTHFTGTRYMACPAHLMQTAS